MVILTGLRFCYSLSTVSYSATNGTISGIDIHDKIYWHEDDLIMSYCCKGSNTIELLVSEHGVLDRRADK